MTQLQFFYFWLFLTIVLMVAANIHVLYRQQLIEDEQVMKQAEKLSDFLSTARGQFIMFGVYFMLCPFVYVVVLFGFFKGIQEKLTEKDD